MTPLTEDQVSDLANRFLALAQAIGDFRFRHWDGMTSDQRMLLARQHLAILNYSEDFLAQSAVLVMKDVSESLSTIDELTGRIQRTLAGLANIEKGISLSAAIVKTGAAILSENPVAIGSAIEELGKKWGSVL